jgi:hypothetical protein
MAREKREERFRNILAMHNSIHDFFQTTDPVKICKILDERRATSKTLEKQIADLRDDCEKLEEQMNRAKSEIEEAEYTSAKGVGVGRLLAEGQQILAGKQIEKRVAKRELETISQKQRQVTAGCHHLREIMALVECEGEVVDESPAGLLKWIYEKLVILKEALQDEDPEYLPLINKQELALLKAKEDAAVTPDEPHKRTPKTSGFKRGGRDTKLDVTSRVLTRAAVKALAVKTTQGESPQRRRLVKA